MEITFYSPHLELSSAFITKVQKAVERIVRKATFLTGFKLSSHKDLRARVIVEKSREFHHKRASDIHPADIKENGKFKLTIELIFSGQRVIVEDYGEDLYFLVDVVRNKLEEEIHRYRKKKLRLEKKGSRLWKKLKIWHPEKIDQDNKKD